MRLNVLALFTAPRGSATLSSEKLSCFGGGFLKENTFFWTLETSLVLQQEGAGVEEPFSPLWGMQGWLLFLSSFRAKRCPVVLLGLSLNYVKQQLVDAAIKGDEGEGGWEQKEAQRDPSPWRTAGIQVHKENPRLQIPPLHSLLGGAIDNLTMMIFSFIGFRASGVPAKTTSGRFLARASEVFRPKLFRKGFFWSVYLNLEWTVWGLSLIKA